jgi:hypothetical protein
MGLDIHLPSIFTDEVCEAVCERVSKTHAPGDVDRIIDAAYAGYAETGGYFRDPYNRFGLLPILDIDIYPLVSEDGTLPIEAARFLLAEVESRELTPASIEAAILGSPTHPMVAMSEHLLGIRPPDPDRDNIDWLATYAWLIKKRETLIALLRRSIELNEPLHCSG